MSPSNQDMETPLLLHLKLCSDTMCAKYYCRILQELLPTSEQMSTNSLKVSSCCMTLLIACHVAQTVRPDWMLCDERRSDVQRRALKAWTSTSTGDVLDSAVQSFRQQPKKFFADGTCQHWDSSLMLVVIFVTLHYLHHCTFLMLWFLLWCSSRCITS